MSLPTDTRIALWGLAARVGLEITALDTGEQQAEALAFFNEMRDREILAGVQNKQFAQAALRGMAS